MAVTANTEASKDRPTTSAPVAPEVSRLVEHLFRQESGKMVATLTGIFGVEHMQLAEDVVQEALARALQTWPFHGVPRNPAAWIMRASRNLALDVFRRQKAFRDREAEIIRLVDRENVAPDAMVFGEEEIADDRLRMMFVCCHPQIPADDRVALALKTLCGFSPLEIARAFLTTEAAIAKRLTRAKRKIRQEAIRFEIPSGAELTRRLDGVLQSLYLLFNEGYKASSGEQLVREDICREAIQLAQSLAGHPAGNRPKTHALLALMLLNTARTPSRVDNEGNLLRLREQDRSLWNHSMIASGMFHLSQSAVGEEISRYHLLAGIAACHCAASDFASTDWNRIVEYYDLLMASDDSPVIALNRAVALAEAKGVEAGMEAIRAVADSRALESYYLFHAVLGEFESRLHNPKIAAMHFGKALQLADLPSEQGFLLKRLTECKEQAIRLRADRK